MRVCRNIENRVINEKRNSGEIPIKRNCKNAMVPLHQVPLQKRNDRSF